MTNRRRGLNNKSSSSGQRRHSAGSLSPTGRCSSARCGALPVSRQHSDWWKQSQAVHWVRGCQNDVTSPFSDGGHHRSVSRRQQDIFLPLLMMSLTPLPVALSSVSEINLPGTQICHMFFMSHVLPAGRRSLLRCPCFILSSHPVRCCCHVAAVSLRLPPAVNQHIETETPAGSHPSDTPSHPTTLM